ncbi:MAG: cadherin-like beta sandwich domain-containing protein, partial [Solirubrobacteraceae bacterium]
TKTGTQFPTYENIVLKNIHVVKSTTGSAAQAAPIVTLLGLNQTHRTLATLNNVVVDGIDGVNGVQAQYADLRLGPGPVNFRPRDNVSPPGSPSTVTVTSIGGTTQGPPPQPISCTDRFGVVFPDYGNDISRDNNASLRGLALVADGSPVSLGPAFASGITTYTASVPFRTQTVTISPAVSAAAVGSLTVAQDAGSPVAVASGGAVSLTLPPAGGSTLVTVRVVAEDGVFTTIYRVVLSRVAAGTDASLVALTDSAHALAFDPAQTSYAYSVPAALASDYTVTPTARDASATILVNGAPVASGTASAPIDLSAGAAMVSIVVTAEDGLTSITYTLSITVSQETIPVTGIALSASSLRLDTTTTTTAALVATLSPPGATDRAVTWASSNPAAATVDATGVIHAVAAGQTVITVTSHDGGFTASCNIRVFSLFFSDDFEAGSGNWDLLPLPGPNGAFSIASDGTSVLK